MCFCPQLSTYAEYWKVPFPIFSILRVRGCDNVPGPDGTVEDKLSLIYLHSCRFTVAVYTQANISLCSQPAEISFFPPVCPLYPLPPQLSLRLFVSSLSC